MEETNERFQSLDLSKFNHWFCQKSAFENQSFISWRPFSIFEKMSIIDFFIFSFLIFHFLYQIWTRSGPDRDQIRSRSGADVDQIWSRSGPDLDQTWIRSGPDQARLEPDRYQIGTRSGPDRDQIGTRAGSDLDQIWTRSGPDLSLKRTRLWRDLGHVNNETQN